MKKFITLILGAIFHTPEWEYLTKREKVMKAKDGFFGIILIRR